MTHADERDIVEKLAEKFYRIYGKHVVDMRPWASIGHEARGPYRALAEEALRQMEYARRETVTVELGVVLAARDAGFERAVNLDDLALAPEGWTP